MNSYSILLWLIPASIFFFLVVSWTSAANWLVQALLWIERRRAGLRDYKVQCKDINFRYALDRQTAKVIASQAEGQSPIADRRPTLLLLHGFGGDVHHWLQVAPLLARHFRLFIPDLPGYGDTPLPKNAAGNMESQAQRVLNFMDEVGLKHCIVGGNSMGAYLAATLAHLHPERVDALWLMNPGGVHAAEFTQLLSEATEGNHRNALIPQDLEAFQWLRSCVFVKQPFLPHPIAKFIVQRCRQRRVLLEKLFNDLCFESKPLDDFAQQVKCPTLLIWGDRDRVLHPSGFGILATKFPHVHSIMMKDVGHCPMLEVPKQSVADFVQYVNSSSLNLTTPK